MKVRCRSWDWSVGSRVKGVRCGRAAARRGASVGLSGYSGSFIAPAWLWVDSPVVSLTAERRVGHPVRGNSSCAAGCPAKPWAPGIDDLSCWRVAGEARQPLLCIHWRSSPMPRLQPVPSMLR